MRRPRRPVVGLSRVRCSGFCGRRSGRRAGRAAARSAAGCGADARRCRVVERLAGGDQQLFVGRDQDLPGAARGLTQRSRNGQPSQTRLAKDARRWPDGSVRIGASARPGRSPCRRPGRCGSRACPAGPSLAGPSAARARARRPRARRARRGPARSRRRCRPAAAAGAAAGLGVDEVLGLRAVLL